MALRSDPWTVVSFLALAIVAAFLVLGPALAWRPPSFSLVVEAPRNGASVMRAVADAAL